MSSSKQIEAYDYYKKLYPGVLVFFHVKDQYVALFDDARRISELLHCQNVDKVWYKDTDLSFMSTLGSFGEVIKIIDFRNKDGDYDYPDIQLLQEEKSMDY